VRPIGPIRLNVAAVLVFCVGCTCAYRLNIIGEISLVELLLPAIGIPLIFARGWQIGAERRFWRVLVALLLTLAGYMLSDYVCDSPPDQYLRGWGRIALVITDFVFLSVIIAHDRRNLWWFAAGLGLGGVLYLRLVHHFPLPMWKFGVFDDGQRTGYSEYMVVGFAAFALLLPPRLASLGFVWLGLMSFHYDFRSHGGICGLIAAVMWLKADRRGERAARPNYFRWLVIGAALAGSLYAVLRMTENDYTLQRRTASDVGRQFGLEVGLRAVLASPLIGHGSWGTARELATIERQVGREDFVDSEELLSYSGNGMSVHSEILQSWVEGGILGASFFLYLGLLLIKLFRAACLDRPLDPLTPIILYFFAYGGWDLVNSPFAATTRLHLALAAAVLVMVSAEITTGRRALRAAWRARAAPAPGHM